MSNESNSTDFVYFDDLRVDLDPGKVIQVANYYPYGMEHPSSWMRVDQVDNKNRYNGGSEYEELLQYIRTPFRFYDPTIGRFMAIDQMANVSTDLSPYHYAGNNPVNFNDPTGLYMNWYNPGEWEAIVWRLQQGINLFSGGGIGPQGPGSGNHWADGMRYSDWSLSGGSEFYRQGRAMGLTDLGGILYRINADGTRHKAVERNGELYLECYRCGDYAGRSRDGTKLYYYNTYEKAQNGGNPMTPWEVGWEWLTGNGPRHRDFTNGDYFTEMLRRHDHIASVRNKIANGGAIEGSDPYDLSGIPGVGKYLKDYSTLATGGLTGNIAVTYLGSYVLTWQGSVDGNMANIVFTVTNSSTIQSAIRPPVIGYTDAWKDTIGAWLNQQLSSGPMSRTTQTFRWTETIPIR